MPLFKLSTKLNPIVIPELMFKNKPKPPEGKVYFDEKPVDLFSYIYLVSAYGKIYKLVQYSEGEFTWVSLTSNHHWFLPNGRTVTLDEALMKMKKNKVTIIRSDDRKSFMEYLEKHLSTQIQ